MIEITGDYWEEAKKDNPRYDAFVCTTNMVVKKNGCLVMGAGIAKDFRDRFRNIDLDWGRRINDGLHINGFMVTTAHTSLGGKRIVDLVAFPTKQHWKNDASPELIKQSALTLARTADILGWKSILMTRPGCGLGNLDWTDVKRLLDPILDNRFRVIHRG